MFSVQGLIIMSPEPNTQERYISMPIIYNFWCSFHEIKFNLTLTKSNIPKMFQMFFTQQKTFVIRQLVFFLFFFLFFFFGGGGGGGCCCCLFSTATTGFYTFSFASMDLRNIEKKQLCFLGITKFSLGGKVKPSVSHFDYLFCFKHLVITISLFCF